MLASGFRPRASTIQKRLGRANTYQFPARQTEYDGGGFYGDEPRVILACNSGLWKKNLSHYIGIDTGFFHKRGRLQVVMI